MHKHGIKVVGAVLYNAVTIVGVILSMCDAVHVRMKERLKRCVDDPTTFWQSWQKVKVEIDYVTVNGAL
jgi:hypothetical protein